MKQTLVFVYNANSDFISIVKDITQKLFNPDSSSCQLANLTYSAFGRRREWQAFIQGLDQPCEFLHKNELKQQYPDINDPLPAIFIKDGEQLKPWLGAKEINRCQTIIDLRELITDRLN